MNRILTRSAYLAGAFLLLIAGWTARGIHAGRTPEASSLKPSQSFSKAQAAEKPESVSPDLAVLETQLQEQAKRVRKLEQEENMGERISHEATADVALIVGQYIWTDQSGKKPLRYSGMDESGGYLRDKDGHELVDFDGDGPVVLREFEGTGFLIDSGHVLTGGFVTAPWESDPLLERSNELEIMPSTQLLHAYFPGITKALNIKIDHVAESGEAVLCVLDGSKVSTPGLNLDHNEDSQNGEPLTFLGYPGGVDLLASMTPDEVRRKIYEFGRPSADEVAQMLAESGYIHPIAAQSRIIERSQNRVFVETVDNIVNAGGPLINARAQVVAISQSTHPDYPSVSMAALVAPMKGWIDSAVSRAR
jgi:hypothetical protein